MPKVLAGAVLFALFFLPSGALSQADETAKRFHILPHIADGGGWRSIVLLTNISQSANPCTFTLYGMPLSRFFEVSGVEVSGSAASFEFGGQGTVLIWATRGESAVATGYATLDCSDYITAQVIFNSAEGMATVFSSQAATVFQFPVLNPDAALGFAIANDNHTSASCRVLLFGQRDTLGEAVIPVPAESQKAQMLNQAISIPETFRWGIAGVVCDQPVAIIGLHFELRPDGSTRTFTTLPPTILVGAESAVSRNYVIEDFATSRVSGTSLAIGIGAVVVSYRLTLRNPTNQTHLYTATLVFRDRDGFAVDTVEIPQSPFTIVAQGSRTLEGTVGDPGKRQRLLSTRGTDHVTVTIEVVR